MELPTTETIEISKLPSWHLSELITDCYARADYVGDETKEGMEWIYCAEALAVELQDRTDF